MVPQVAAPKARTILISNSTVCTREVLQVTCTARASTVSNIETAEVNGSSVENHASLNRSIHQRTSVGKIESWLEEDEWVSSFNDGGTVG